MKGASGGEQAAHETGMTIVLLNHPIRPNYCQHNVIEYVTVYFVVSAWC